WLPQPDDLSERHLRRVASRSAWSAHCRIRSQFAVAMAALAGNSSAAGAVLLLCETPQPIKAKAANKTNHRTVRTDRFFSTCALPQQAYTGACRVATQPGGTSRITTT